MAQRSGAQKKKNKGNKLNAQQQKRAAAKRVARAEEKTKKIQKKDKKKRTGKEIAIIVVSIVMVVSILLPSLSSIVTKNSSSSKTNADGTPNPTSYEEAESTYQPKVDEAKAKLDKDSNDQQAMYDLATDYYNWASKASSYAKDDQDKKNKANKLYQDAIDEYSTYLDAVGNFDSSDAKTAALNRAMAYKALDNKDKAKDELKTLGEQANYANAWANLAMLYENDSQTQDALIAYGKAATSADMSSSGSRNYAMQRLQPLRKKAQQESGGPGALFTKCNFWHGYHPQGPNFGKATLASVLNFNVQKIEKSDSSDSKSATS